MEDTRPPEEFVSSHPPAPSTRAPRTRAWRLTACGLALALLLVLATGAWSLWRPLSDDDGARLTARATVESVRSELHPDPRSLPDEHLARQLDALAPAATPTQQRQLDGRGAVPDAPASLDTAADDLARLAQQTEDADLTFDLAAVAASWWAGAPDPAAALLAAVEQDSPAATASREDGASHSSGGAASPHTPGDEPSSPADAVPSQHGERDDDAQRADACGQQLLAAVSAVDRSLFVAQAAAARATPGGDTSDGVVDAAAHEHRAALTDSRVAPALACDPPPVAGLYELPADFTADPARATGAAEREARDTLVRAAASSSGEQRAWVMDTLRTAARCAQALDPQHPVPALPGRS